jgi:hypothetical protein
MESISELRVSVRDVRIGACASDARDAILSS